jgi:hypothetical protein
MAFTNLAAIYERNLLHEKETRIWKFMNVSITESKQVLLLRFSEQVASIRSSLSDWCYVTDETGSQYAVRITQLLFFLQNTEKPSSDIIKLECQSLVAARSKVWVCNARLLGL